MSTNYKVETPGDGNPQANAKGRVYSMDPASQSSADSEEIEVAGLKSCSFGAMMLLTVLLDPANAEGKPEVKLPPPPTVTIQCGPGKKKG